AKRRGTVRAPWMWKWVVGGARDITVAYLTRCPSAPECPRCSLTCPSCPSFACQAPASLACPMCPSLSCPPPAAERACRAREAGAAACPPCPACEACEDEEGAPCDSGRSFVHGLVAGALLGGCCALVLVKLVGRVALSASEYVGTTPDGDTYIKNYDEGANEDVDLVRWSAGWIAVPPGVDPARVYRFRLEPVAAQKQVYLRDAELLAQQRCQHFAAQLGRPDLLAAPGFLALIPGGHGAAAPAPAGAAAGAPAPGPLPGVLQGAAAPAAVADRGARWRAAQSIGDFRYGDEVAAHVASPGAVQGRDLHVLPDGAALFVEEVAADDLETFMGRAVAADARVLPVVRTGARREVTWASMAARVQQEDFGRDWLVAGPRTAFWCIDFINNEGMGIEHYQCCLFLRLLLLSDQCDGTSLQACEAIFRRLQTIEHSYLEKVREREGANQSGGLSIEEQTHFSGSTRLHSSLMVRPGLLDHIWKEVEREAALSKNLRRLCMMNLTEYLSGLTRPLDTFLATLFHYLCLQWLLPEVEVEEFCLVVASSGLGVGMLVTWMFVGLCAGTLSLMQQRIMEHVRESVDSLGAPPTGVDAPEAPRKLRVPSVYGLDAGVRLGSCNPDLLALPAVGNRAVPLAALWGEGGRRRVADFVRDSVLPAGPALERKMSGVRAPYSDPSLRRPRAWGDFVSRLHQAGLLDFACDRGRESVEFFCVPKKVLERLLGHMGFISLVRRESLSVFDTVFAFIRRVYNEEAPLWASVVRELTIWGGVSPLLRRNLKVQWLSGAHDNGAEGLWDVDGGRPRKGGTADVLGGGLGDARESVFREVPLGLLKRDWKVVGRYRRGCEAFGDGVDECAVECEPAFISGVSFAPRPGRTACSGEPPGAAAPGAAAARRPSGAAATVCQTHSARPATSRLYAAGFASFKLWLKTGGRPLPRAEADCDHVLSLFLDAMYLDGAHLSLGQRMLAAAPKGWNRLVRAGSRLAIPFEVMCMLVMWMWFNNLWEEGLLMWLTFEMYCRPNEPLSLRAADLAPPVAGARAGCSWSLNLHAREHAVASKTEEFDEAMQLDLERQAAPGPALAALLQGRHGPRWRTVVLKRSAAPPPLLKIAAADAARAFSRAVKAIKLGSVGVASRCQLRHGGAGHGAATGARSLGQIRHRGRWRAHSSLRGYEKGARLGEVLERLPPKVRAHALRCADSLGDVAAKRRQPFDGP
ncbi:unnamed protein product, partial [Prorocentrum cordatum]